MKLEDFNIGTREWFAIREAQKNSLPIMSEHEIEIIAERMQDRLDKRFMTSDMTQEQYNQESREITAWVEKTIELIKWHACKI